MQDTALQLGVLRRKKTSLEAMLEKVSTQIKQTDIEWLNLCATQADKIKKKAPATSAASFESAETINRQEADFSVALQTEPVREGGEEEEVESD